MKRRHRATSAMVPNMAPTLLSAENSPCIIGRAAPNSTHRSISPPTDTSRAAVRLFFYFTDPAARFLKGREWSFQEPCCWLREVENSSNCDYAKFLGGLMKRWVELGAALPK